MQCKCGNSFSSKKAIGKKLRGKNPEYASYAVINDVDYRKFLKKEIVAFVTKKSKDIAKAAKFVGTMYQCPECGRLAFNRSDGDGVEFYTPEA